MFGAPVSSPDPYYLINLTSGTGMVYPPWSVTDGKTQVSPRLVSGEKTGIILAIGQSTISGHEQTLYTPTNTKVENLSIYNGGLYNLADPIIGPTNGNTVLLPQGGVRGGCWLGRLADKMRTAGWFDRVIMAPIGIGATHVMDWENSRDCVLRTNTAVARLNALSLPITAVLYMQGESDCAAGITQSVYAASLANVFSHIRSLGVTAPIFVSQTTYIPGNVTSPGIRAAQAAIVDHANPIWAGPDTDVFTGLTYRYDDQHWNAAGSDAVANAWLNSLNHFGAPFVP